MTKSNNTKHALLMSIVSMLLCVAMLAGSTFAWFTDSVSSGVNRIVAGNLDVRLSYKTGGMTDWRDVESLESDETDPFFRNIDGDKILWEPGAAGVTSFKVENAGTLAFKYALALLAVKYNQFDGRDLRDVIKFALIEGETDDLTAEEVRNLNYSAFPDFTKRSQLSPGESMIFTVVAYWSPNSDSIDNLYNLNNGRIATELDGTPSDPNELYIDIDVRLNAWQDTVESDSFDNQYDSIADALDVFPDGCFTVTEHNGWAELDIYTGQSTAEIKINHPGYVLDPTLDPVDGLTQSGDSTAIKPTAANGHTHLLFFKTADTGSFTLTQDGRSLSALQVKEDGTIVSGISYQSTAGQSGVLYSPGSASAATASAGAANAPAVSADLNNAEIVSNEEEMLAVIAALNENGGEKTVKLNGDIDLTKSWSLEKGTLTILGEGYCIINKTSSASGISIKDAATFNLGADNYDKSLTYCVSESSSTTGPLIYMNGNACVNICEGVVIDGKRNALGGAVWIYANATVNLRGGTIQNCISHGNLSGGILMVGSSTFNMYSGEIKDCQSWQGPGAISITPLIDSTPQESFAVFNMYGGTISGCSGRDGAPANFAAIYVDQASIFNMSGGTIENCKGKYGGGVYTGDNAVFNMSGGTIENCTGAFGGGVYMQATSTFNMSGGTIKNCTNSTYGGGVCMNQSAEFNMSDKATIENCQGMLGGGVIILSSSKFDMSGGTIANCCAEESGGGVFADGHAVFDMSGGTIANCCAEKVGGGVFMQDSSAFNMSGETKLYNNTAKVAGDDIAMEGTDATLILGEANTGVLSDGEAVDGWYIDDPDNRWGSENYPYDQMKIAAGETKENLIKAAHGEITLQKGVEAPGRLLDLYTGEDNAALISKGGAKTVRWLLKNSDLADRINASASFAAGTKITMAYYPDKNDRTIVEYYYLIVSDDTNSILLSDFNAVDDSERFSFEEGVKNSICQLAFVFPEGQNTTRVWMSNGESDQPNESAVAINFAETGISVPSGTLAANGNTVTVSGLTGFEADQSDSRHNTMQNLADRKSVLVVEAVNAKGKTVSMPGDTLVTVGGIQVNVSAGIAAVEISEGAYAVQVSALPQGATEIRVSLCYADNDVIYKSMSHVLDFITVKQ